uniref:Uncharacterized protein n=1 Tax=Roseihalotalea indica TaxID=2867963 RepID=A0AA49GLG0_9BACT|nr:hypothetical protein K4G66_18480 [Tunicatimonas sp. TK19036]
MAKPDDFNRNAGDPRKEDKTYDREENTKYFDKELNDMEEKSRPLFWFFRPKYFNFKRPAKPYDEYKGQSDHQRKFNTAHDNVPVYSPKRIIDKFYERGASARIKMEDQLRELKNQEDHSTYIPEYKPPIFKRQAVKDLNAVHKKGQEIRNLETKLDLGQHYNDKSAPKEPEKELSPIKSWMQKWRNSIALDKRLSDKDVNRDFKSAIDRER